MSDIMLVIVCDLYMVELLIQRDVDLLWVREKQADFVYLTTGKVGKVKLK